MSAISLEARAKKRERERQYQRAHPEKVREASRRYRAAHPERRRETVLKYYAANREKADRASRQWVLDNPERVLARVITVLGQQVYIPTLPPELQEVARLLKHTRQAIREAQSGRATQ